MAQKTPEAPLPPGKEMGQKEVAQKEVPPLGKEEMEEEDSKAKGEQPQIQKEAKSDSSCTYYYM